MIKNEHEDTHVYVLAFDKVLFWTSSCWNSVVKTVLYTCTQRISTGTGGTFDQVSSISNTRL